MGGSVGESNHCIELMGDGAGSRRRTIKELKRDRDGKSLEKVSSVSDKVEIEETSRGAAVHESIMVPLGERQERD